MNEDQRNEPLEQIEAGAAGAPEGAVNQPTADDVKAMYDELGIKAPAPTGKPKGRPKTASVRAEDDAKNKPGDPSAGSAKNADDKGKSKDAPASSDDGDSGDDSDAKGAKKQSDSRKVQNESGDADKGVRKAKSDAEEDSERRGEDDTELGDNGARQEGDESDDEAEEGKRPGKSNPAVEKRFQRLTEEKRAAEERAAELERKLSEKEQAVQQSKIAQEDPEYTIDDFRKVRDEQGNIIDLDPERAELAWRRWKDGYDQRAAEREASYQREQQATQEREEQAEQIMRSSVAAYDHLASMMDDFPELVESSGKFDADFAAKAMPIINKAIIYAPGTEPGNPEGNQGVVIGLRIDPREILDVLRDVKNEKRTLPLNGLDDNIESRSNVSVPHSRSSDSTVNAANELYKELGINKRI
jgi:hypothetical protein